MILRASTVLVCLVSLSLVTSTAAAQEAPADSETEEVVLMPVEEYDSLRHTQQWLEYGVLGSLAITAGLGIITYFNQPTLTTDGLCVEGDPIFGSYGCEGLSTLHGISGVTTVLLYTSAGVMDLALPEAPGQPGGRAFDDPFTYVHVGGMAVLPLLGIISSFPGTIGIESSAREDFSRTTRTIHASVAVITAGAYVLSLIID